MAGTPSIRTFNIPVDTSGSDISIKISEPPLRANGLSLETWASSYIVATLLHRLKPSIRFPPGLNSHATASSSSVVPVLELGAGTGLVGLSAAVVWKVPITLTDLPPIVPGLAANIALNDRVLVEAARTTSSEDSRLVSCGALDWNNPGSLHLSNDQIPHVYSAANKSHVILAADTVYSSEHPALLSSVILQWLSPDADARAIICYPMRVAYLDEIRELWHLLEQGGLEPADEGRETASESMFDDECLCEWSVWRWRQQDDVRGGL